jgi:hypothetical protein
MNNKYNNVIAIALTLLIVFTGFFKFYLEIPFDWFLRHLLAFIGISYENLDSFLSSLANDGDLDFSLGIFGYYLLYLALHLLLIEALFRDNLKLKRALKRILISLILLLVVGVFCAKYFGFKLIGNIMYDYYRKIVGRPLILFLIEGGGLIYNQVEKEITGK